MKCIRRHAVFAVVSLAVLGVFLGLSASASDARAAEKSLYERLGGLDAITAVVDRFAETQLADKRIGKYYRDTDIAKWKGYLVTLICKASGGPCAYNGRPMAKAHARKYITDDEFNWTAGHLVAALDHFKVPVREKGELVAIFVSLKDQVVGQ